jgi:hypothetical protein
MVKTFNLAGHRTVFYAFNPETGYYTKSEKQPEKSPVMRLPYELKFAITRADKIKCNAKQIIHSRLLTKTGQYLFFTGLQETGFQDWYLGNDYEYKSGKKVISIVLFHFMNDNSQLAVYYFPKYDKPNTGLRLMFAKKAIPLILNT